jgi:hypothetical protein
MNPLAHEVVTAALEQAREALRTLPEDATPNLRASVVTTAVRALTAWKDLVGSEQVPQEQGEAESPA